MRSIERTGQRPRGVTLLELLIVMVIMLMVTAAAIPMIAPAMRNRQMREATRLVSAYFGAARARAVQTGRPVGIVIERLNGGAFALQMSQVEVPTPYAGDFSGSKLSVGRYKINGMVTDATNNGIGGIRITTLAPIPSAIRTGMYVNVSEVEGTIEANGRWKVTVVDSTHFDLQTSTFTNAYTAKGKFEIDCGPCIASMGADLEWKNRIRYGDEIRFDYRGRHYTLTSIPATPPLTGDPFSGRTIISNPPGNDTDGYWFLTPTGGGDVTFPDGYITGVPYQIYRQPVRSTAQPLTLPEGIVVDLSVSGVGSELFNTADYNGGFGGTVNPPLVTFDPIIVFSPSGRLDYVTNQTGQLVRPTGSVNLLMGRRELMFDVTTKGVAQDIVFQNLSAVPSPNGGTLMPPAENFWMTIGYQTGQVSVSQVAPHYQSYDGTGVGGVTFSTQQDVIDFALTGNDTPAFPGALGFARESQSLGGR